MLDIQEVNQLPKWPFFFKDRVFVGNVDDLVWVVTNNDYTTGYILGQAAEIAWGEDYRSSSVSESRFEKFSDILINAHGRTLYYVNIDILYWNEQAVHIRDRSTGETIIILATGVVHSIFNDEIFMSVGESSIHITAEEITLTANVISLGGQNGSSRVQLGSNPKGKVMTIEGVLGSNSIPSDNVWA
jgi:hypothetical protein